MNYIHRLNIFHFHVEKFSKKKKKKRNLKCWHSLLITWWVLNSCWITVRFGGNKGGKAKSFKWASFYLQHFLWLKRFYLIFTYQFLIYVYEQNNNQIHKKEGKKRPIFLEKGKSITHQIRLLICLINQGASSPLFFCM